MPWQSGSSLTLDVTVVNTLTSSYTPTTSVTPCGTAKAAASPKRAKHAEIIQSHIFVPIAIETLGPINMDGKRLLDSLGERLSSVSGDPSDSHIPIPKTICSYQNFQFSCPSWYSPTRDSYQSVTQEPVFNFVLTFWTSN